MTAATVQRVDFRKSCFIEPAISRLVRSWLDKAARLFQQRWDELAPQPVRARPLPPQTMTFGTLLDSLGTRATGCRWLAGAERFPSLLTVDQPGIQVLLAQILCDQPREFPAPRELTGIELDLAQLLFDGLRAALSEGWPQRDPLPVEGGPVDPEPRRQRMYAPDEYMAVVPLGVMSSAGEVRLEWAMPRQSLRRLLAPLLGPDGGEPARKTGPQETVLDIPVPVRVTLGTASLGMDELARLQVGDVIVLESAIDEPVPVSIGDERVFRGWPGRVGPRQAIKISDRT